MQCANTRGRLQFPQFDEAVPAPTQQQVTIQQHTGDRCCVGQWRQWSQQTHAYGMVGSSGGVLVSLQQVSDTPHIRVPGSHGCSATARHARHAQCNHRTQSLYMEGEGAITGTTLRYGLLHYIRTYMWPLATSRQETQLVCPLRTARGKDWTMSHTMHCVSHEPVTKHSSLHCKHLTPPCTGTGQQPVNTTLHHTTPHYP